MYASRLIIAGVDCTRLSVVTRGLHYDTSFLFVADSVEAFIVNTRVTYQRFILANTVKDAAGGDCASIWCCTSFAAGLSVASADIAMVDIGALQGE